MKLLFERSRPGRGTTLLPACDVPVPQFDQRLLRTEPPHLPEIAEVDLGRHYTCLLYTSPSPRDQRGSRMPSSA